MVNLAVDDEPRGGEEAAILRRVSREIRIANALLQRTEAIVIENSSDLSDALVMGIQHFDRISQFLTDLEKFVTQLSEMSQIRFVMSTEVEQQWRRLSNVENWVTCETQEERPEHTELF